MAACLSEDLLLRVAGWLGADVSGTLGATCRRLRALLADTHCLLRLQDEGALARLLRAWESAGSLATEREQTVRQCTPCTWTCRCVGPTA